MMNEKPLAVRGDRQKARKLLVAVDGSAGALEALEYVTHRKFSGEAIEAVIVNVQPPIRVEGTTTADAQIGDYQWYEGEKVLGSPTVKAHAALLGAEVYLVVGDAAEEIVSLAEHLGCAEIVLGDGRPAWRGRLLPGSIRLQVMESAPVPVVVVKSRARRSWETAA